MQSRYGHSWYLHPMSSRPFHLLDLGQMSSPQHRFQFAVKSHLGRVLIRYGCLVHGGKSHLSYLLVLSSYQMNTGLGCYLARNPYCKIKRNLQGQLYQNDGCNGQ